MCDVCGSDTGDEGPCDNCSMTQAARSKEKEVRATAAAIKKGHRQTEAKVLTENALRWCANMLVEVQANHAEYLGPDTRRALHLAVEAVQDASHLSRGGR